MRGGIFIYLTNSSRDIKAILIPTARLGFYNSLHPSLVSTMVVDTITRVSMGARVEKPSEDMLFEKDISGVPVAVAILLLDGRINGRNSLKISNIILRGYSS